MDFLNTIGIGAAIGVLVGLTGTGSGSLLTPLLILVARMTPVTAVGMTEINQLSPGNIIEAVTQMPQFLNNETPATAGSAVGPLGAAGVNLRGIGSNRTLVLLDGRRVPSFNRLGTPDVSTFPESMIRGIEVVTGGASAAYGSDAVSGTVNFLLDTDYTGIKGHVQGGITERNDYGNYEFSISGGHDLGEQAHFIAAIDYFNSEVVEGLEGYEDRDWFDNWGAVDINGSGRPRVVARDVHSREYTAGGLIVLPGSALNMIHFLEGGVPVPFQNGTVVGATSQAGGTGFLGDIGSLQEDGGGLPGLAPGVERGSAFFYGDYDFNADWTGYFQYMYGKNKVDLHDNTGRMYSAWGATIYRENAFLPASIAAIMDAEGRTSFPLRRYASTMDLGQERRIQDNDLNAYTVGFEGELNDIRVQGYYQYGEVVSVFTGVDYTRTDRMYRALDSMVDPLTGAIKCRSTLTLSPNDGCVPANPFGPGTMSQEAVDYILGTMWRESTVQQHFAELSADTEIFDDWQAGAVSVAAGISYREDSFDQFSGPADLVAVDTLSAAAEGYRGLPGSFVGDNLLQFGLGGEDTPIGGAFDVVEVFGETLIPLVRDMSFVQAIDLSGAVRYADYSGSGGVLAWKAGLDWRINDDFRVRLTRSHDTRAATLRERYDQSGGGATINDPQLGGIRYVISQLSGGNPAVEPEESDTWTAGLVFTPTFLDGFSLSADWYDIKIEDYIFQLGTQRVVDDCFAGAAELCALITRDSATNQVTLVQNFFLNVAEARATGVDLEASYRTPLSLFTEGNEDLSIRFFASWLQENSFTNLGAPKQDNAGNTNTPEWTFTTMANYRIGPLSAAVTGRYLDSRVQFTSPTRAQILDDNTVDSMFITNLRLNYEFDTDKLGSHTLFLNVANLFDQDPPIVPEFSGFFGAQTTNPGLHDLLGRRFTVGLEFEF